MADNDDIPFNRDFPLKARRGRGSPPRRAARALQQSEPVHLHRHGQLHRGQGQRRHHRSRPGRRGACQGAARCGARRDGDAYPRHPHPSRPFAEHRADQGRHRRARSMPKARTAPRGRASRAKSTIRNPAPTAISGRTSRSRTATSSKAHGWRLEAVATPGHTANHLAFAWPERKINFVGDHVMGWSTSIVAPPDGSMIDYMDSLDRLASRDEDLYFSGHGPEIPEGAALRALPRAAPPRPRSLDPASPRQGRRRYPDHGARDLYRPRSAADGRRRLFRAGASGRSGRARHCGDRRRSRDRRHLPDGV